MHLLLRYPEIITNLDFIKVSTMPLELRPGIPCHKEDKIQDGEYITTPLDNYKCNTLELDEWQNFTGNQLLIMNELKLSNMSIDKVTKFGLQPP